MRVDEKFYTEMKVYHSYFPQMFLIGQEIEFIQEVLPNYDVSKAELRWLSWLMQQHALKLPLKGGSWVRIPLPRQTQKENWRWGKPGRRKMGTHLEKPHRPEHRALYTKKKCLYKFLQKIIKSKFGNIFLNLFKRILPHTTSVIELTIEGGLRYWVWTIWIRSLSSCSNFSL